VVVRPVQERLRISVKPVLQDVEVSLVRCSEHERVKSSFRDTASILTTDVNEERAVAVSLHVVFVVSPVSLSVSAVVLEVEVIDFVHESCFSEIRHVHDWQVFVLGLSAGN
jgi:hypothetical protein